MPLSIPNYEIYCLQEYSSIQPGTVSLRESIDIFVMLSNYIYHYYNKLMQTIIPVSSDLQVVCEPLISASDRQREKMSE